MIYVDNAATTQVSEEVLNAMMPYLRDIYGNPSSVYSIAQEAKSAIDASREAVAKAIGAKANEIYFTACGSEADNWAIKGAAEALKNKGMHLITSKIEHHAVLHSFAHLGKQGYKVTYLPVDEYGLVNPKDFEEAITDETTFASIMLANNEIGTIEPICELAEIAKKHGVVFHTDAVQAIGHIPVDVTNLGVDMLSMSAHKFEGPKGIGCLYLRSGLKIAQFMDGGGQERGKRAGTENISGIVGMAKAIEIATDNLDENMKKMLELRERYITKIQEKIPYIRLNGHREKRLPGNANFSFEYVEGESILLSLDMEGICASSGSACTSGSLDPSHVLLAIGLPHGIAHGSIRTTFSHRNTIEEVDFIVDSLVEIIERLRLMSPLYEEVLNKDK